MNNSERPMYQENEMNNMNPYQMTDQQVSRNNEPKQFNNNPQYNQMGYTSPPPQPPAYGYPPPPYPYPPYGAPYYAPQQQPMNIINNNNNSAPPAANNNNNNIVVNVTAPVQKKPQPKQEIIVLNNVNSCPVCGYTGRNTEQKSPQVRAFVWCIILMACTLFLFWIPFVKRECYDTKINCGKCGFTKQVLSYR